MDESGHENLSWHLFRGGLCPAVDLLRKKYIEISINEKQIIHLNIITSFIVVFTGRIF